MTTIHVAPQASVDASAYAEVCLHHPVQAQQGYGASQPFKLFPLMV